MIIIILQTNMNIGMCEFISGIAHYRQLVYINRYKIHKL